jgi:hypothetical protein
MHLLLVMLRLLRRRGSSMHLMLHLIGLVRLLLIELLGRCCTLLLMLVHVLA